MINSSTKTPFFNFPQSTIAIAVLTILYIVGIFGILLPLHEQFILLTPVNLLVSLVVVLTFQPHWNWHVISFLVICYAVGWLAELLGVQTGLLFGNYEYGPVLGPKIWGTPLMIGVNWIMLTYCAGVVSNYFPDTIGFIGRAVVAALLMVALDVLIEPVAMTYDFWNWENDTIPLRNFLGWFVVAFPLQLLFQQWIGTVKNKVAVALFLLQTLFFLALNIF